MDVARDNVRAGRVTFDLHGRATPSGVMAREQTAGRGQRGRVWHARAGECLCATYYFGYGLATLAQARQIAFVAGIAAAETLQYIVESVSGKQAERPVCVGLKWPNDVLLNGRKAGGILIETIQAPPIPQSVSGVSPAGGLVALVGVGLNIDALDFPPELEASATSLRREGLGYGNGAGWRLLGERLADALAEWGAAWQAQGLAAILPAWRAYDQTAGRRFETDWEGIRVGGIAEGVNAEGALLLRLADTRLVPVHSASALAET